MNKFLKIIAESRHKRIKSLRYPVNAGLMDGFHRIGRSMMC